MAPKTNKFSRDRFTIQEGGTSIKSKLNKALKFEVKICKNKRESSVRFISGSGKLVNLEYYQIFLERKD